MPLVRVMLGEKRDMREVLVREGTKPHGRSRGLGDKKWAVDKWVGMAYTGFIWLEIGTGGRLW